MSSESKRLYICGGLCHTGVFGVFGVGATPICGPVAKGVKWMSLELNDLLVLSTVADLILSRIGFFPLNALTL
jgi:hypothetical protein